MSECAVRIIETMEAIRAEKGEEIAQLMADCINIGISLGKVAEEPDGVQ